MKGENKRSRMELKCDVLRGKRSKTKQISVVSIYKRSGILLTQPRSVDFLNYIHSDVNCCYLHIQKPVRFAKTMKKIFRKSHFDGPAALLNVPLVAFVF